MPRTLDAPRLCVATHNPGKTVEIRELLAPWGIDTVSAGELGLPVPEETETTFAGNAALKARAAAAASGLPSLADDSGICVAMLDGAPGVHTADWAETPQGRDFGLAMAKVNGLLDGMGAEGPRRAFFTCTLCLAWPDGHAEVFRGEAHGRLTWPPRGDRGHGYDPMFVPDRLPDGANPDGLTYAEIDPGAKNAVSHRAEAFALLMAACLPPLS